jgi:hypothetical protein
MEPQMNHQSEGVAPPAVTPDMLPVPQPESLGSAPGGPEMAPVSPEMVPQPPQPGAFAPPSPDSAQAAQPPAAAAPLSPAGSTVAATPALADDADLIEKEWVVKAKQIVERTRDDPFTQSKELNKMKADYIHKRYNKQIKLAEG